MRLKDKVVIVTGSRRGIGRAIVTAMAKEGAHVVINDLLEEEANEVVEEVRDLGREALLIIADVTKAEEVDRLVNKTIEKFGKIDILVNNAGIFHRLPFEKISEEIWDRTLGGPQLKGAFLCSIAVAKWMLKQKSGKIINVSGSAAFAPTAEFPQWSTMAAAVVALTKSLARWLAPYVQVNSIAPGYIETALGADLKEEARREIIKTIPLKRFGKPEEIAKTAVFLASSDSDFITSQTIVVDGGRVYH